MFARILAASLGVTLVVACQSSSRYGTPTNAAVGTGLAVAAAAVNRAATHECWAACRPGTICDKSTGLCVEPGLRSGVKPASGPGGRPLVLRSEAYSPGHEYEVPAESSEDAGCGPVSREHGNGSGVACEMDGAAL